MFTKNMVSNGERNKERKELLGGKIEDVGQIVRIVPHYARIIATIAT